MPTDFRTDRVVNHSPPYSEANSAREGTMTPVGGTARRPLVAGNWKMNGVRAALDEIAAMGAAYDPALRERVDLLICPPATLIPGAVAAASGTGILIGAQDCHSAASGAHTGDLSAEMLRDAGASTVIVGHSERRADHAETDEIVRAKAAAALRAGLTAIVCVGETRGERERGDALGIVTRQVRSSLPDGAAASTVVVAYEPVWAIGTGLTPTRDDVAEMHDAIRAALRDRLGAEAEGMRLLYGGSVKPANAADLMSVGDVDGALVGGASLKASDFLAIAGAYRDL